MSEQRHSQWRGIRAKSAAWWFNTRARTRVEHGVLETIRSTVRKDDVVLDLGAGTGFFALAVAPMLDGGRVVALDLSPDMLSGLVRHATRSRLTSRIEPVVAEATKTGLPDASVNLVISGNLLHELPDPAAALNEMARVLKPGGHVVIQDFHDGIVGRLMKALHHHQARGALGTDEIGRQLRAAGFSDVRVTASGVRYLATGRKNSICEAQERPEAPSGHEKETERGVIPSPHATGV
ncbi:methyltransferase domain-containing protein [Candidatus Fermentibacteria bacterium]|nr:methyltransferase domain-containing protein [Candidatus Fermentibacteria bacterium]